MIYTMVQVFFIVYKHISFHLSHTEYQVKLSGESRLKHSTETIFITTCRKSMSSLHLCEVLTVVCFLAFSVAGDRVTVFGTGRVAFIVV